MLGIFEKKKEKTEGQRGGNEQNMIKRTMQGMKIRKSYMKT
jgi:hypothetical protein